MAISVVEKVVAETGVPAEIEVVDVISEAHAQECLLPGSPTVRVAGLDVDRQQNGRLEFTSDDRVYRTDRGLAGWPDERWVRDALLLAVAQTTTNGNHDSSSRSSATSP
jgi:SLT domain-containing protein